MTCPNETTLSAYLDERLSEEERRGIEKHVSACDGCLDFLLVAHEARKKRFSTLRLRRIARTIFFKWKKPELKWLILGGFFFVLSFVFKHYFLQFLAVSVVLGFKWVMEGEGGRKAVMIFKGMEKKEKIFERKPPPPVSDIKGGDKYGERR